MAELQSPGTTTPEKKEPAKSDETVTNLKSEMNRKFENLEATNKALLAKLTELGKPVATPAKKEVKKDFWDAPEEAVEQKVKAGVDAVLEKLRRDNEEASKKNQVIGALYGEFPELADNNHPLTQKAVEIFNALPEMERQSPLAYRLAVKEAAMELKVPNKKSRAEDYVDSFSLSGGGSGSGGGGKTKREPDLDPRTVEAARLLGLDMDDEKQVTALKKTASRKNWNKWQ